MFHILKVKCTNSRISWDVLVRPQALSVTLLLFIVVMLLLMAAHRHSSLLQYFWYCYAVLCSISHMIQLLLLCRRCTSTSLMVEDRA